MPVEPLAPRYQIKDLENKLVVSVPSLKVQPFLLLFAGWTAMWSIFEIGFIAILVTSNESSRFGALLLVLISTLIGAFLLYNLLWLPVGKEEIDTTTHSITIRQVIFGYRRSKEYLADQIRALGLAHLGIQDVMFLRWPVGFGSGTGSISFDYGARTYKFAGALDDAEAKQVIAAIQQKYPQYKQ